MTGMLISVSSPPKTKISEMSSFRFVSFATLNCSSGGIFDAGIFARWFVFKPMKIPSAIEVMAIGITIVLGFIYLSNVELYHGVKRGARNRIDTSDWICH